MGSKPASPRGRPSPSMVVAGLALLVALARAAIADPLAEKSVLNKPEKKQVKRIAKNQANSLIDQRAPGLSVAHAGTAGSATSATDAINATNALNAASANQASNATTANGVTVESLRYHVSPGSPPVVLVSMGGLALTASCDGGDLSL